MTLVLENSLNSKKVQFVLELSLNFEKKLLDNHKKSLMNDRNSFFMDAMAIKIKRIAKLVIENEVRRRIFYSILFDSSSTNRMQPEVKPYKAEIGKGKNESSMWRQYTELKSGRNNELERGMRLRSWMDRNPAYKQC